MVSNPAVVSELVWEPVPCFSDGRVGEPSVAPIMWSVGKVGQTHHHTEGRVGKLFMSSELRKSFGNRYDWLLV